MIHHNSIHYQILTFWFGIFLRQAPNKLMENYPFVYILTSWQSNFIPEVSGHSKTNFLVYRLTAHISLLFCFSSRSMFRVVLVSSSPCTCPIIGLILSWKKVYVQLGKNAIILVKNNQNIKVKIKLKIFVCSLILDVVEHFSLIC